MYISTGVTVWLVLSSLIVIYDAMFILLRPQTLKGGAYYSIYQPYELYLQFDHLYGNLKDHFVPIIAWLNLVEVSLTFFGLLLVWFGCKATKLTGSIILIMASAFIFWKTVLYMWYDRAHLSQEALQYSLESIYLYYIPNGFWLICPLWSIYNIAGRIGLQFKTLPKKKNCDL